MHTSSPQRKDNDNHAHQIIINVCSLSRLLHFLKIMKVPILFYALLGLATIADATVVLNEVVGSTTSTDVEFVELFGTPGESLADHSIVIVERDAGAADLNTIDAQFDFGPQVVLGENGFLLVGNDLVAGAHSVVPNLFFSNNFVENGSYLIALVKTSSISGNTIGDLGEIVDHMFVLDGDAADAPTDGDAVALFGAGATVAVNVNQIGPDGTFLPAGYRRDPDGSNTFVFADFGITTNTPVAGILPEPELQTIMEIQGR